MDVREFMKMNAALQTTNNSIYAAEVVERYPQFNHVAGVHGGSAQENLALVSFGTRF